MHMSEDTRPALYGRTQTAMTIWTQDLNFRDTRDRKNARVFHVKHFSRPALRPAPAPARNLLRLSLLQ